MNHRLGTCSSCNAQYKVPASFQADRAKCKSCGGVVEIGPVGGGAPAAAVKPAAKPAPRPADAPSAPARPVPARPVAAAPQPVSQAAPKPAPKPLTEEKDSVRAAANAAAERVRDAGRKSAPAAAAADEGESKSGSRKRSKAGAGAGRHTARKQKSKAPMLAAVVVLMVAGGGATWFLTRGDDTASQAAEKGTEGAAESAPETPAAAPVETATPTDGAASAPQTPAEAGDAAGEAPALAAEEPPPAKPADEDIDLGTFPDESKLPGTSDEDWASIQTWTTNFLDANAGAAGNRARSKLFERGRESFPALLNAMKRLDFSTDDGFRAGDLAQRFLMDVCNGQNFDWRYGTAPTDVIFNKKVVRSWIKAWEQGRETPKAWAKLTKTTAEDAAKLFAITGPFDTAGEGAASEASGAASSLDDL